MMITFYLLVQLLLTQINLITSMLKEIDQNVTNTEIGVWAMGRQDIIKEITEQDNY